jgi:hypothetical protein
MVCQRVRQLAGDIGTPATKSMVVAAVQEPRGGAEYIIGRIADFFPKPTHTSRLRSADVTA